MPPPEQRDVQTPQAVSSLRNQVAAQQSYAPEQSFDPPQAARGQQAAPTQPFSQSFPTPVAEFPPARQPTAVAQQQAADPGSESQSSLPRGGFAQPDLPRRGGSVPGEFCFHNICMLDA